MSHSFVKLKFQPELNLSGIKIKTINLSLQSIITNSFYNALSFICEWYLLDYKSNPIQQLLISVPVSFLQFRFSIK